MALGGGSFTQMNKTLPGAYINFVGVGAATGTGVRGVATLPLVLDWGPEGTVFPISAEDYLKNARAVFGHAATDPALLLVSEALKRAQTLLCYRVNPGGARAAATVGGLPVTAKYSGTRGNDIRIVVRQNVDDEASFDVLTYLDNTEVDAQTVPETGVGLAANDFVAFGVTAGLTVAAATPLTGGTNGEAEGQSYADYLAAIEVEEFNAIGYPGVDETVKALFAAFVKRLRYDEGRKVTGVLYQYAGDDIGLINVENGVVLPDGTRISGDSAVAWVTAATAGAEINQSLTNTAYDGAVDVDVKYTKSQYEAAIRAGKFVFYADGGTARVLSDINSFVTITPDMPPDWTSNMVVRVMDGWANDVARIFGSRYIGTINSETGRALFKADLVSTGTQFERIDAISGFSSEDIDVQQGEGKRDVVVNSAIAPNGVMEKLYMTTVVR